MGSLVISVDAELGWGFCDYEEPPVSRVDAARTGWRVLLDILETHEVPATWAIVGHLFLNECDGLHAEHPSVEGWFERERGPWSGRPDLRFGTDLIGEVADGNAAHELACHSFSHVLFGAPETTREIARAELAAAVDAGRSIGVEFESFVFPRNSVGHRDLLAAFGFRSYRGAGTQSEGRFRRIVGKLLTMSGHSQLPLVTPTVDEYGLVDIPPSMYLFGFEDWPRRVTTALWDDPIVRMAKRGIDRASREEGLFHLWLHPNNLQTDRDRRRIHRIVAYAAAQRDRSDLRIETMADVAARVDNRDRPGGDSERVRPRNVTFGR
ncbi:polysaccharide deacetylase family protein [Halodesulfurarchaeum formicicum]|uniref:Polysaccharide deacetylase n=1 Tax=Halodesulfurarchaeum formicicum TaxID=1873524 RepID=A0A1J1AAC3_9EURY|nr:polysaccharide deacetylase family protein [Halodesulfurarchaeum formicicum]APE95090.1 polysaccharide deacetylase [Halodesulfurarchaeum formicicum]